MKLRDLKTREIQGCGSKAIVYENRILDCIHKTKGYWVSETWTSQGWKTITAYKKWLLAHIFINEHFELHYVGWKDETNN